MDTTLDILLTAGALIIGILILTGHGSFFMKGGNDELRKKLYDEAKMEKGAGISLILLGIATGINMFTTGLAAKIGYIVVLVIIFAGMICYLKTKCKK